LLRFKGFAGSGGGFVSLTEERELHGGWLLGVERLYWFRCLYLPRTNQAGW
jgi:hypothetical protein